MWVLDKHNHQMNNNQGNYKKTLQLFNYILNNFRYVRMCSVKEKMACIFYELQMVSMNCSFHEGIKRMKSGNGRRVLSRLRIFNAIVCLTPLQNQCSLFFTIIEVVVTRIRASKVCAHVYAYVYTEYLS